MFLMKKDDIKWKKTKQIWQRFYCFGVYDSKWFPKPFFGNMYMEIKFKDDKLLGEKTLLIVDLIIYIQSICYDGNYVQKVYYLLVIISYYLQEVLEECTSKSSINYFCIECMISSYKIFN